MRWTAQDDSFLVALVAASCPTTTWAAMAREYNYSYATHHERSDEALRKRYALLKHKPPTSAMSTSQETAYVCYIARTKNAALQRT